MTNRDKTRQKPPNRDTSPGDASPSAAQLPSPPRPLCGGAPCGLSRQSLWRRRMRGALAARAVSAHRFLSVRLPGPMASPASDLHQPQKRKSVKRRSRNGKPPVMSFKHSFESTDWPRASEAGGIIAPFLPRFCAIFAAAEPGLGIRRLAVAPAESSTPGSPRAAWLRPRQLQQGKSV